MDYSIEKYKCVSSTNTVLKEMTDAKAGTVVIAEEQTAGRGRMGRSFISEAGGLYMSVLFMPETVEEQLFIPILAAVAVHKALSEYVKCSIKWPNDILVNGKKLCGILAEAQGRRVILGIGVNISSAPDYAVSLFQVSDEKVCADTLAKNILNNVSDFEKKAEVIEYYRENCGMLGEKINVIANDKTYEAKAVDIAENG